MIERLDRAGLEQREARAEGRIKRKLLSLKRLCGDGRTRVIIADGRVENPVSRALDGAGTHIA